MTDWEAAVAKQIHPGTLYNDDRVPDMSETYAALETMFTYRELARAYQPPKTADEIDSLLLGLNMHVNANNRLCKRSGPFPRVILGATPDGDVIYVGKGVPQLYRASAHMLEEQDLLHRKIHVSMLAKPPSKESRALRLLEQAI